MAVGPHAGVVGAHRKLMPTYQERLVWGIGDVFDVSVDRRRREASRFVD
jgi:nitrilase